MELTKLSSIASEPWVQEIEANAPYNEPIADERKYYHYVYCWIDLVTHWCYIGKHSDPNPYDTDYTGSTDTYENTGLEDFTLLILGYCRTSDEAYKLEERIVSQKLIDEYSGKGIYNKQRGGHGGYPPSAIIASIASNRSKGFLNLKKADEVNRLNGYKSQRETIKLAQQAAAISPNHRISEEAQIAAQAYHKSTGYVNLERAREGITPEVIERRAKNQIGKKWICKIESHERKQILPEEFWYWEELGFNWGYGKW